MFYRNGCYSKTRNLRVRPIREHAICLVFTPANPTLFKLNSSAWGVLDMCDGRTGASLETSFRATIGSRLAKEKAIAELQRIIQDLEEKGIVKCRINMLRQAAGNSRSRADERR